MKNMDSYYGFRFASFVIVWLVLIVTMWKADNPETIISSFILYLIPIALDYYGQTPLEEKNQKRSNLAFWVSFWATVLFLGILLADFPNGFLTSVIAKLILTVSTTYFIIISCVDWVLFSTEREVKFRESVREHKKKQQEIYKFEDRVKDAKKAKDEREANNNLKVKEVN